jgi:hypothetical protein
MRSSALGSKRKKAAKGIWISNLQHLWCKSRGTREMPVQASILSAVEDQCTVEIVQVATRLLLLPRSSVVK